MCNYTDEIQQLSSNANLQAIVHDYFDELMTVHSIICNHNIKTIETSSENDSLLLSIDFHSELDRDLVYMIISHNPIFIRYDMKISISCIITSHVGLYITAIKIKD